jgi:hypothetical protein
MPGWLDARDVASHLGMASPDAQVTSSAEAAEAQVETWREDLALDGYCPPDVYKGAVLYAALLVQSRNTPDGFAGFDDAGGMIGVGDQARITMIYRLVGARRPKVG